MDIKAMCLPQAPLSHLEKKMQLLASFIPTFHPGYQRPGEMISKPSTGQRCFPSSSELAAALCRVTKPGRNSAVYANIWD